MKILIVEDEVKIADSLKKGLTQEKYTVDVCYSGYDGYELSKENTYDLIILDLMLPEINGLEITKRLRDREVMTPIIMLTAKGQLNDKLEGFSIGADDYITKPLVI